MTSYEQFQLLNYGNIIPEYINEEEQSEDKWIEIQAELQLINND